MIDPSVAIGIVQLFKEAKKVYNEVKKDTEGFKKLKEYVGKIGEFHEENEKQMERLSDAWDSGDIDAINDDWNS